MTLTIILFILLTHYIADFWVQTHKQSINKSTNLWSLTEHIITYTLSWFPILIFTLFKINKLEFVLPSALFIFITHWLTDFVTSKAAKLEFENQNVRTGFQIIGLDQMVHYITLFYLFDYILQ